MSGAESWLWGQRSMVITALDETIGITPFQEITILQLLYQIDCQIALKKGKNVFSIPGNINSCMSEGCHKIIKEGATLIHSVEDILNEYQIDRNYYTENSKKYDNIKLNEKSIEILELIKDNGILNIDEICDNTKMEVKYINAILNELVLKDLLIEMNNQVYSLNI